MWGYILEAFLIPNENYNPILWSTGRKKPQTNWQDLFTTQQYLS